MPAERRCNRAALNRLTGFAQGSDASHAGLNLEEVGTKRDEASRVERPGHVRGPCLRPFLFQLGTGTSPFFAFLMHSHFQTFLDSLEQEVQVEKIAARCGAALATLSVLVVHVQK